MRNSLFDSTAETSPSSVSRAGSPGPLRALLGFARGNQVNVSRRLIGIVAIVWLPIVVLTALTDGAELPDVLRDYVLYSRMVIAVPALLLGALAMDTRFRLLIEHVRNTRLLDEADQQRVDDRIARVQRPRDAAVAELIIAILVACEVVLVGANRVTRGSVWAVSMGSAASLRPAGWYYLIVSVPIYQFLMLLNIWRWLAWSYVLYQLSRMNLQLVATHPDERGGLGFLGLAPAGFIPTAVALATTIGGAWRYEILHEGTRLVSYALPAAVLLGIVFLLELGPLCFFVPRLYAVRSRALLEYGILAQTHVKYFERKWIMPSADLETERLDAADVTNLALYGASYDRIKAMRPFPIDKSTLVGLAAAVAIPLFPVVLAEIPISVIVRSLIKAVEASPF
jgi:hypothetical protein